MVGWPTYQHMPADALNVCAANQAHTHTWQRARAWVGETWVVWVGTCSTTFKLESCMHDELQSWLRPFLAATTSLQAAQCIGRPAAN